MVEIILEICKVTPSQGSPNEICLPLTFFDLIWLKIPTPELLFFYEAPLEESYFQEQVLPKLKHSLSITLQHFVPLSGNLTWLSSSDKPVVFYKEGDGVSLTVAVSDADFHHISGKSIRECRIFRPLVSRLVGSDSEVPVLAFKVTLFPKKGFCICITVHHGIFDGKSMTLFMKSWASVFKFGCLGDELNPVFDRETLRKGYMELESSYIEFLKGNGVACNSLGMGEFEPGSDRVRGTFELSGLQVRKLKKLVGNEVTYVSTLIVSYAYVILCMVKTKGPENKKVLFGLPVDIRGRLEPTLSANYVGNCIGSFTGVLYRDDLLGSDAMAVIVNSISRIIKGLDDTDGVLSWVPNMFHKTSTDFTKTTVISVLGLSRFGFHQVDFSWGNPIKVDNTLVDKTPAISITEVGNGGVDVALSLNKHEMEKFSDKFAQGLEKITKHIFPAL